MTKPLLHVTAGIIEQKGLLLITQRPKGAHLADYWEFPGGKQEPEETLAQCLEREIAEELGIRIRAEKELMTVDHAYDTKIIRLHVFQCTLLNGEPKAIECQAFKWVSPNELKHYQFPPPDMEVIEKIFPAI